MSRFSSRLLNSIYQNLVAIISLVVAVTALNLSVERGNRSEFQHNIRDASFRVLSELSQLQLLVDNAHYSDTPVNPIAGWARVNYMQDLAAVIPEPVPNVLNDLFHEWQRHINQLGIKEDDVARAASLEANRAITKSINESRNALREVLRSLE